MKPFDRMLCVSAWALPVGIVALLAGLTTASVVAWRGGRKGISVCLVASLARWLCVACL